MVESSPKILRIRDYPALPPHMHRDRLISGCTFVNNDSKLNFYQAGNPIHSWYTNCPDPEQEDSNPIFTNIASIDVEHEGRRQEFEVDMPFYGIHTYNVVVDIQSTRLCQISYFALAKSTNQHGQTDVFVVRTESYSPVDSCGHNVDLDKGRVHGGLGGWTALALLAGFKQCYESSLGTILAISPKGTRIAAASWSRVLFWSLDPSIFHHWSLQNYFPTCDYNTRKCIGRLRPTLLPSEGVIHKLLWIDETKLCAISDRGLAKWDIGHMSDGRREILPLENDVWPETAVATGEGETSEHSERRWHRHALRRAIGFMRPRQSRR